MKFSYQTLNYKPCPDNEEPGRFSFECPKRVGVMCSGLLIRGRILPDGTFPPSTGMPSWAWDGNRDAPTFLPSINCTKCSHGHITNGKWKDA